ncbi:uncharacterized protein BP5553_00969 [Venustampulla echinocandica]|uniref:RRM domain-containing protein n=1 Tax=Venustampulla echinocandica TaxID=2656787 RepID=A0A370TZR2_9HELO|nr:uncharacterized protein BP5553_00969 [Venustampulla echinocandica]RDL40990.1 hypothetical protein BP5553_00969 [Venustampulla echinocandica]
MISIPSEQPPLATPAPPSGSYSEMPMNFYQVPFSSQAIFSTLNGLLPKRTLEKSLPPPIVRSNFNSDVIQKAEILREKFPTIARSMTTPTKWEDLYQFFDGYDLYADGAVFCFYVISEISRKNQYLAASFANEIFKYAAEWISYHKEQVLRSPPAQDLIDLFLPEELEGLDTMTRDEIQSLGVALEQHRRILLEDTFRPRRVQPLYPVLECSPDMAASYLPPSPMFGHQQGIYHGSNGSHGTKASLAPILSPVASDELHPSHPRSPAYNTSLQNQHQLGGAISHSSNQNRGGCNNIGNFQGPNRPRGISLNNGNFQAPNRPRWPSLSNGNIRAPNRPRGMSDIPRSGSGLSKSNFFPASQSGRRTVSNTARPSPSKSPKSEEPIWVHTGHSQISSSGDRFSRRISSCSSSSKFRNIFNDARVLESMDTQGRRSFAPSSSKVTATVGGPREPQHSEDSLVPLDIPFANDPRARISYKGTSTYFYTGDTKYPNFDEQYPRTVYVGNVTREAFVSHELHRVMERCGEVESITYLNRNPPSKTAFVAYSQLESVNNAIWRLHGFRMESGDVLIVSPSRPRKRERADSQFSQRSYGSSRSIHPPREFDAYRPPPRRHTGQNQPLSYAQSSGRNFSPPAITNWATDASPSTDVGIAIPAMSAMSEFAQHQAALNRLTSQLPLNSVQNLPTSPKKPNGQGRWMQPCAPKSPSKSENRSSRVGTYASHTPSIKGNSPNKRPQKSVANNEIEKNPQNAVGWRIKGRASKQNTSARPTPAASPVRSRSMMNLDEPRGQPGDVHPSNVKLGLAATLEPVKLKLMKSEPSQSNTVLREQEPKQKGRKALPKKKHSVPAATGGNSSFSATTSSAVTETFGRSKSPNCTPSPVDELVSAKSMTSLNTLLSNQESTITTAKSDTNLYSTATKLANRNLKSDIHANPPYQQKSRQSTAAKRQRKGNNKEYRGNQKTNILAKESESYLDMQTQKDHGQKSDHKTSRKSSTPVQSKDNNENNTSAKAISGNQTRLDDTNERMLAGASYPPSNIPITISSSNQKHSPKQHGQDDLSNNQTGGLQNGMSKNGGNFLPQSHSKKASSSSSISNGSLRKSDVKSGIGSNAAPNVASDKVSNTPQRSQQEVAISKQPQPAIPHETDISDPKKWPALGPVVCPLKNSVVEGKRLPPNAWTRSIAPRRAHSGPIIPAVPLLKNIRPQP